MYFDENKTKIASYAAFVALSTTLFTRRQDKFLIGLGIASAIKGTVLFTKYIVTKYEAKEIDEKYWENHPVRILETLSKAMVINSSIESFNHDHSDNLSLPEVGIKMFAKDLMPFVIEDSLNEVILGKESLSFKDSAKFVAEEFFNQAIKCFVTDRFVGGDLTPANIAAKTAIKFGANVFKNTAFKGDSITDSKNYTSALYNSTSLVGSQCLAKMLVNALKDYELPPAVSFGIYFTTFAISRSASMAAYESKINQPSVKDF